MLRMDDQVAERLLALNREFYDTFAEAFRDSRAASEPGFERILAEIEPGDRVLDLGCGQGRLASLLPAGCVYTGVDYAGEMVRVAQDLARDEASADARFVVADLVSDPWPKEVGSGYDWVVLRAVLHHIPDYSRRLHIVERAAKALTTTGVLAIANWQFVKIPRLMRRVLSWETVDLGDSDVDAGDYLLDWQRDGYGMRYVHLVDEGETRRLAQDAGLRVHTLFSADGHTNDLTLYALLKQPQAP